MSEAFSDYLEASLIYENQNLLQILVQNCYNLLLVTHLTQLTVMSPLTSAALGLNLIRTLSDSGILPHPEKLPPLIFPVRNLQALSQQLSTLADISLSLGSTHRNSIYLFWGRSLASVFLDVSKGHKHSYLAPRFGLLSPQRESSLLASTEMVFVKEYFQPCTYCITV